MLFKSHVVTLIVIFVFNLNLSAQTAAGLETLCREYKPYSIDISSLQDFYQALPVDEKQEQLRDWAYYGLLVSLGVPPVEINNLTGMDFPMRYIGVKDKFKFPILSGRVSCPDSSDCVLLVAESESGNKLLQGRIYDRQMIASIEVPKHVHIFSYAISADGKTINTEFVRTVPGSALLSSEYGYYEKEISGSSGLKEFLRTADDIVSVKVRPGFLALGGRKTSLGQQSSLSCEDLAVLYQAYITRVSPAQEQERRKKYDIFLSNKYSEVLRNDKKLRVAIKAKKIKYNEIMAKIRKAFPYAPLEKMDSDVGFSLDPIYDFKSIAAEINELAVKSGKFSAIAKETSVSKAIDIRSQMLSETAEKIRLKQDITPLLKFRRGLMSGGDIGDMQLDSVLQQVELDGTYQIARYDGKMKGTSAAMILFYTDLTAKLWALDYNGTSPKNIIAGFRALSDIKVPKLYWKDFVKLSKTRLWFGLRSDSFDISGDEILFEPVSARVYAASSDPLYPGKETIPNYQSGEFLGWWDDHYSAVADYEPYYCKLNELLKWSCVMMVLKEKKAGCLDFLKDEPVTRSYDFESWYKNTNELKNKIDLPYVDRHRFNRTEECFKILQSKGYPLMGTTYFVSGGVSLASKKDIDAKLSKRKQAGAGVGKTSSKRAKKVNNEYSGKPVDAKKRNQSYINEPEKNSFGEFSAFEQDRSLKLQWSKSEGAVLDECVNSLVSVQAMAGRAGRSEGIFKEVKDFQKVVRIELGRSYLIKPLSLQDKWIHILVDPQGKADGYQSKASGTEPDSSLFYAKTISAQQAEKMIEQSKGVYLFE